jgi:hypothetical protein
MHDFTLLKIVIEWATGVANIFLLNSESSQVSICIDGLVLMKAPRLKEWGESVSINNVRWVTSDPDGNMKLEIEMQSGDVIEIIAKKISLPQK